MNATNQSLIKRFTRRLSRVGWGDRNTAKTRHADEVRDTVDLEIILVDKARIETEDVAINKMRVALQNRGVENVIIVATKTDVSVRRSTVSKPKDCPLTRIC